MMARAVMQRWPVTPEYRNIIIRQLMKVIADPNTSAREKTSAAKALMSAEQQNQADEHKVVDVRVTTRHDNLDAIAADLGIDLGFIEDASRAAAGGIASPEADGRRIGGSGG